MGILTPISYIKSAYLFGYFETFFEKRNYSLNFLLANRILRRTPIKSKDLCGVSPINSYFPTFRRKGRQEISKDLVHRQVPLPMPCYDFSLVTNLILGPAMRGLRIWLTSLL